MTPACACGAPATANGRECPKCWLERVRTVTLAYHPSATPDRARQTGGTIDGTESRRWEGRLEDYRKVRKEGSRPRTTRQRDIDRAKAESDATGSPSMAGRPMA